MSELPDTPGDNGDIPQGWRQPKIARIPKGLLFPVRPNGPIELNVSTLDGDKYALRIGGVSMLGGSPDQLTPALCFRHFRVLLKLAYLHHWNSPMIPVRYSDLLSSDGHNQRVALRRTLTDLGRAWMHKIRGQKVESMLLLTYNPEIYYHHNVDTGCDGEREKEENISYRLLRQVTINEDFFRAFLNWSECWNVRPDVVEGIWSDTAAATYMMLVPTANHPEVSESNPARKNAATLLAALGYPAPKYPSQLRQVFERSEGLRGGMSVLEQLNGRATWKGVLRVREELEANAASTGFNVVFWAQREKFSDDLPVQSGALLDIWKSLGLPHADFVGLQRPEFRQLLAYEVEQMEALGYSVEKSRRFLELVRSFIGPVEFACVIGEAKATHLERPGTIRSTMDQYLGGLLRNEFKSWALRRARGRR